jgi:hypothetical protein
MRRRSATRNGWPRSACRAWPTGAAGACSSTTATRCAGCRWIMQKDRGEEGGRVWSEADAARLQPALRRCARLLDRVLRAAGPVPFRDRHHAGVDGEACGGELKGVILYGNVTDDLAMARHDVGRARCGAADPGPLRGLDARAALREAGGVRRSRSLYADTRGTDRRLAAHRWMIDHVYPECHKSGAVSRDRTYGQAAHDTLVDIDLAVSPALGDLRPELHERGVAQPG